MIPQDRMIQILQRFEFLEAQMATGDGDIAQIGREYAELRPVVEEIRGYRAVIEGIAQAEEMLGDLICLQVDGKMFMAQCQMSLNVPMWRKISDGCLSSSLPQQSQPTLDPGPVDG